jgi:hypothetical protein
LQCPSHKCPRNSTVGGRFCVFKKSWTTSMLRLLPREKQELPMQIVMLARGGDASSPEGESDAFVA